MRKFGFTIPGRSAGAALIGMAVVMGALPDRKESERPGKTAGLRGDTEPRTHTKAGPRRPSGGPAESALAREIRRMSIHEVRDQLPVELHPGLDDDPDEWERIRLLFRRYGELEGAQALDAISGRYAKGALMVNVMTEAVIGWMAVDAPAATAAFVEMMRAEPEWKRIRLADRSGLG